MVGLYSVDPAKTMISAIPAPFVKVDLGPALADEVLICRMYFPRPDMVACRAGAVARTAGKILPSNLDMIIEQDGICTVRKSSGPSGHRLDFRPKSVRLFCLYTSSFQNTMSERRGSTPSSASNDDPLSCGVGARVTISVMSDRYVEIILGALKQVDSTNLIIETGDVSTYIGGSESNILRYLNDLSHQIATTGYHSTIIIHLFRGCPGAVTCQLPIPRSVDIPQSHTKGPWASAEWTLYPLTDNPGADHMRDIYAAIEYAKENGTFVKSDKSVTRLEGELGLLLETAVAGWIQVGRSVQHVVSHLSISVNSPSHKRG